MERCIRCKRDFNFGSVIPVKVEGEKIIMVHFFCATSSEVRNLYGRSHPVDISTGEPKAK